MILKILYKLVFKYLIIVLLIFNSYVVFAKINFKKTSDKSKFFIILIDETDSFGKNGRKGVAESLYWDDALTFIKTIIDKLNPEDCFIVLAIDDKGFEEEDILIPLQELDRAFLKAKMQKNKIRRKIMGLKRRKEKYNATDILGQLYYSAHLSKNVAEREVVIFCFSDMRQEPKWPTTQDAKDLVFSSNVSGYFFFVDASGKKQWDKIVGVWKPIFEHAGLNVYSDNTLNFYQYGESALRLEKILSQW